VRRVNRVRTLRLLFFSLGAGTRLAYLAVRGPAIGGDTGDYLQLGRNLASSLSYSLSSFVPFTPSVRRAPAYPVFLALTSWIHRWDLSWIAALQCLLGGLSILLVYELARLVLSPVSAAGAAIACAFHPGLIAVSASINSEVLFIPLLLAGILLVGSERYFLAGVVLGLSALCRPISLPLVFLAAFLCIISRGRRGLRLAGVLVAGCMLVVLPWVVRTSVLGQSFVLIQTQGLANVYLSTLTQWDQLDYQGFWRHFEEDDEYGRRLKSAETPVDLVSADRWARKRAIENINADPSLYLHARLRYYPFLFLNSFNSFTGIETTYRGAIASRNWPVFLLKSSLLVIWSAIPFLLAFLGLLNVKSLPSALCAAVWIYTMLVHLPMWIEYRFWVPVIPFQIISAFAGLALLQARCDSKANWFLSKKLRLN
jgi:4-amino-4-deoxy-L-arabinose transferase-like glycosyltransferase